MDTKLELVKPTAELKEPYLEFYIDWLNSGEKMVPWIISRDPSDFAGMLKLLNDQEQGLNLAEGRVPDTTYWLVAGGRDVVGCVNIRHYLNERLEQIGGHIGYGIRPSARGQGYAPEMLRLALVKAGELGIRRALVTCDAANIRSERTILRNGGEADESYMDEDGSVTKRYWITI